MREIKYRVWDTREAHWEEPGFFAIIGSGFGLRENDYGRWVRTIPDDRGIFMQFTDSKIRMGRRFMRGIFWNSTQSEERELAK
jgi:hypothetical protein